MKNPCKLLKLPPYWRGYLVNFFSLTFFHKLLKSLSIFSSPPPPPALRHKLLTSLKYSYFLSFYNKNAGVIHRLRPFMIILCGLVSANIYADVKCNVSTFRCACPTYQLICENGKTGYVKKDVRLKAIKVQVLDPQNNTIDEKILNTPPGVLSDYMNKANTNPWINQQMPDVPRTHTIKENGVTFADQIEVYSDDKANSSKGQVGQINSSDQGQPKITVKCQYHKQLPISVFRSLRCPNETLCLGLVVCTNLETNTNFHTQAICRAEKHNPRYCPSPTKCMLDETQHIRQKEKTIMDDHLKEMTIEDSTFPENDPVEISPAGSIQ